MLREVAADALVIEQSKGLDGRDVFRCMTCDARFTDVALFATHPCARRVMWDGELVAQLVERILNDRR